ncbi:hypothetical protein SARC_06362 [Sphaeroforma arctica JP610]|uniref:RRM domain-containing protein n=1 Tax=Sphaeroforma arctica JP610 TaxID=667725 RepID=A0A0L0FWV6_9EUKA|nr:hypothetical protein SARC_06362 [Sphaeroforma arctica JP610]KNC81312.1 hypothetical protein SARC_06362 [Sphaeroforma arctica JP610]|eukprot:XP_014155214.1 hypothetical protein SARC_06362 [Sphaeroforma arctica JP610]
MDMDEEAKRFCDLCHVVVAGDDDDWEVHVQGKKHKHHEEALAALQAEARRTIFVRGFSKADTGIDELASVFSHVGLVKTVVFDPKGKTFAFVEFEKEEIAASVVSGCANKPLYLGDRKLTIKPRDVPTSLRVTKQENNVFIDNLQDNLKTIVAEYEEPDIQKGPDDAKADSVLRQLYSRTALSQADRAARQTICEEVTAMLQGVAPGCSIELFGSTVNNLGGCWCDVDMCLLLPKELHSSDYSELMTSIVGVMKRAGCRNVGKHQAKCPVVRFTYGEHNLACDLSFENRLAIKNSELMKSFADCDDRVRPIMYALKAWRVSRNVQITSYALMVMALRYLIDRGTLDPVQQPSEEAGAEVVDNWNISYKPLDVDDARNDRTSCTELLYRLFMYLHTYDYANRVLTINASLNTQLYFPPHIKKSAMVESFEGAVDGLKVMRGGNICVQDPFELSHNLTASVRSENHRHFIDELARALRIMESYATLPDSEMSVDGDKTLPEGCYWPPSVLVRLTDQSKETEEDKKGKAKEKRKYAPDYVWGKLGPNSNRSRPVVSKSMHLDIDAYSTADALCGILQTIWDKYSLDVSADDRIEDKAEPENATSTSETKQFPVLPSRSVYRVLLTCRGNTWVGGRKARRAARRELENSRKRLADGQLGSGSTSKMKMADGSSASETEKPPLWTAVVKVKPREVDSHALAEDPKAKAGFNVHVHLISGDKPCFEEFYALAKKHVLHPSDIHPTA